MASQLADIESRAPRTMRSWLLLLIIAPGLLLLVSTAAIFAIVWHASGDRSVIPRELNAWFPYIAMVNHTCLLLIAIQFAHADGLSIGQLGWSLRKKSWLVELAVGALAGIVIYGIQTMIMEPTVDRLRTALHLGAMRSASAPTLSLNLPSLIAGTLFAGIVEETVYRGYIQRQLTARLGLVLGILITTLGFTVGLHWGFGPWGMLVVFVNGLALAILFEWRRNLLACALAHAVVNALVVIF